MKISENCKKMKYRSKKVLSLSCTWQKTNKAEMRRADSVVELQESLAL